MKHLAPCGHEGTPIFGNFVLCPKCDKKSEKPTSFPSWNIPVVAPNLTFDLVLMTINGKVLSASKSVEFEALDGSLLAKCVNFVILCTGPLDQISFSQNGKELWRHIGKFASGFLMDVHAGQTLIISSIKIQVGAP